MKVILNLDIAKLGRRGDVIEVADGYAINVLIKQGKALQATKETLAKVVQQQKQKKEKDLLERSSFAELIKKMEGEVIVISNLKHDNGHLFAAVTKERIADEVFAHTKLSLNPSTQITITTPIKSVGKHRVLLSQGELSTTIVVEVK